MMGRASSNEWVRVKAGDEAIFFFESAFPTPEHVHVIKTPSPTSDISDFATKDIGVNCKLWLAHGEEHINGDEGKV